MRFELDHLESYDDDALIRELQRVAKLVPGPKLTRTQFDAHAKVSASAVGRRFGGWERALTRAGLASRFESAYLGHSKSSLVSSIKSVAGKLGKSQLTAREFTAHSGITIAPILRVFGSWKSALTAAGLDQVASGRRYTDEECFENLLAVWTQYGRPPQHDEMNKPPSKVGAKAYVRRWGTWRKALAAFVARVNDPSISSETPTPQSMPEKAAANSTDARGPREIPLALRYFILKRDNFRCVLDGRSPATEYGVVLHVDHIVPWAKSGPTVASNLRTLCSDCNLGKGATSETEI